jgi:glycopeptide antibiotics resistance protein
MPIHMLPLLKCHQLYPKCWHHLKLAMHKTIVECCIYIYKYTHIYMVILYLSLSLHIKLRV